MRDTILDFVRRTMEVDDLRDAERWALDRHRQGYLQRLVDFVANEYPAYARGWRPRPESASGLRPYVPVARPAYGPPAFRYGSPPLRLTTLAARIGVTGFGYELLADSTERLVRSPRHHLIYCDTVAIDNPLGPTQEMWFGAARGVGFGAAQGAALARFFGLLEQVEDLIASGALVLVEHGHGFTPPEGLGGQAVPTSARLRSASTLLVGVGSANASSWPGYRRAAMASWGPATGVEAVRRGCA